MSTSMRMLLGQITFENYNYITFSFYEYVSASTRKYQVIKHMPSTASPLINNT